MQVPSSVIARYQLAEPLRCRFLANAGGFSGARIWCVESVVDRFALRCWPVEMQPDRLTWIHRVLRFAAANGCAEIVVPIEDHDQRTFVSFERRLWQLERWAAGRPDFKKTPSQQKLRSAIEVLAKFHQATARFHLNFARSENLKAITRQLQFLPKMLEAVQQSRRQDYCPLDAGQFEFFNRHADSIARELHQRLQRFSNLEFPVQPAIRDIHADHVYFDGNTVSALIDFGAMRIDTVACDLSRLLGSLIGIDTEQLAYAIDLYNSARVLTPQEQDLIVPLIMCGSLIAVMNWLNWIHTENRQFESMDAVAERISNHIELLREAV